MSDRPVHVLYVAEFATGGSVESLLTLVGGLDKSNYCATVLFYSLPDERTCQRFTDAGATVDSLYPRSDGGKPKASLKKLGMQTRIRKAFGRRIESWYESFKFGVDFFRFRRRLCHDIESKIRAIRPDIVHLNNGVGHRYAQVLSRRIDVAYPPSVICGHSVGCHTSASG